MRLWVMVLGAGAAMLGAATGESREGDIAFKVSLKDGASYGVAGFVSCDHASEETGVATMWHPHTHAALHAACIDQVPNTYWRLSQDCGLDVLDYKISGSTSEHAKILTDKPVGPFVVFREGSGEDQADDECALKVLKGMAGTLNTGRSQDAANETSFAWAWAAIAGVGAWAAGMVVRDRCEGSQHRRVETCCARLDAWLCCRRSQEPLASLES